MLFVDDHVCQVFKLHAFLNERVRADTRVDACLTAIGDQAIAQDDWSQVGQNPFFAATAQGILGSAVVQEKVTDLLDVPGLIRMAEANPARSAA